MIIFCAWGYKKEQRNIKKFTKILGDANQRNRYIEWQTDVNRSLNYISFTVYKNGKPRN